MLPSEGQFVASRLQCRFVGHFMPYSGTQGHKKVGSARVATKPSAVSRRSRVGGVVVLWCCGSSWNRRVLASQFWKAWWPGGGCLLAARLAVFHAFALARVRDCGFASECRSPLLAPPNRVDRSSARVGEARDSQSFRYRTTGQLWYSTYSRAGRQARPSH